MSVVPNRTMRKLAIAAALVAGPMATASHGQILYITTETTTAPIGVFYRDAGVWNYAGAVGAGLGTPYGIARNGSNFIVTESAGTQRAVNMTPDGVVTALANPITNASVKGANSVAPNIQSVTFGPDGKMYFGTAFGTPAGSGIWRANADGSNLEQIITPAQIGGTNWNIRDLAIADVDGNAGNGFDVYFGTRGGFSDTGRPTYHFNVNGAVSTNVETLSATTVSPSTAYYDSVSGKLYIGRTGGGTYQVASLNPTGTAQTPTVVFNQADVSFDIIKIGNDILSASAAASANLQLRYVNGASPGSTYADLATISGGVIATARQIAVIDSGELPTATFNGAGTNNNFTTGANYVGSSAPDYLAAGFGPRVTFTGSARLNPTNDVASAKVGSIAFDATAGAYTIGGDGFTIPIAGGISNLSTNTQTFSTTTPITVTGGAIAATSGNLVFNSDVTVASGGLMTLAGANNITFNGKVSGAGNIDKSNTGSLQLNNAANDFTGRLSINRGTLLIDSVGAQSGLGAAASQLSAGGTTSDGKIELRSGVNVNKKIVLSGRSVQTNGTYLPQILNSNGSNTLSGSISLTGGGTNAVVESSAGTLGIASITNDNSTAGNVAILFQGAGNTTITGSIGGGTSNGTTTLTKIGAGTLEIAGYTPTGSSLPAISSLVASGGTVKLDAALPSSVARQSSITIDAGATIDGTALPTYSMDLSQTLAGTGTFKVNTLNEFEDNLIKPGNDSTTNVVGTLTIQGNLRVANDFNTPTGGLFFDLNASNAVGGSTNDLLQVNGDLALSSVNNTTGAIPINITPLQGQLAAGNYRLINYTGAGSGQASDFAITLAGQGGVANYRQNFAISTATNGQVNLVVTGTGHVLQWKGDGAGTNDRWDVNTSTNFLDAGSPSTFKHGDTVQIVDDATADHTINLFGSMVGRIEYLAGEDYTIKSVLDYDAVTTGNQSSALNGTNLVKGGNGTLTIDSTAAGITWSGTLTITQGVVIATGNNGGLGGLPFGVGPLAHDATFLDGGTLRMAGAGGSSGRTLSIGAAGGTLDLQGTADWTLGNTAGVVQFTGTGSRTFTVTGTRNLTYGAIMNDPTGGSLSISKSGGTTLTLGGVGSTYSGALTINKGRVTVGNPTALGSSAGATVVNDTGSVNLVFGSGTFTTAEPFSIAGTGSTFAAAQETTGALRMGSTTSNVTASGLVTISADANIGVDDATSTLRLTGGVNGAKLTKVGNGKLAIDTPIGNVNVVTGLDVQAGQLDLVKSKVAVNYSGTSPFSTIEPKIIAGYAGGLWNGVGINSSTAAADSRLGIGYGEASVILGPTGGTWSGTAVDGDTLLIATALKGDTNLDNTVNFTDLLKLAQAYGSSGKSWVDGDTNYDGTVNFNDLLSLAQNYGSTLTGSFAGDWAMAQSLAPEPTTLLAGVATTLLLTRRRRWVRSSETK